MMQKYKVGDRVRVVGNTTAHGFKIGEVVKMVSEDKFEHLDGSDWWLMNRKDYEAVESEADLTLSIDIAPATAAINDFAEACERAVAALTKLKEMLN